MNAEQPVGTVLSNRPAWARDGNAISARCDGDWLKAEATLKDVAQGKTILETARVALSENGKVKGHAVYARLENAA